MSENRHEGKLMDNKLVKKISHQIYEDRYRAEAWDKLKTWTGDTPNDFIQIDDLNHLMNGFYEEAKENVK